MSSHLFTFALLVIVSLFTFVKAQGDAIPESFADGIPNAEVVTPRITMLRFLRQNPYGIGNLNVSTLLIRVNDGNEEQSGSDTELGSRTFRGTFFVPTDSAWEQFVRRLYTDGQVPNLSTPSLIARAVIARFEEIRELLADVETLYRTVRYHLVPGSEYYTRNVSSGVLPTLSGYDLTVAENGTLYDNMSEPVTVTGMNYLLSNGWIIPIEKVLIPFNITEVLDRIDLVPSAAPSTTPSPSAVSASASPSLSPVGTVDSPSPSVSDGAPPSPSSSNDMGTSMSPVFTDSDPSETADGSDGGDNPGPTGGGSEDDEEDGVCFPASSRVHLAGGSQVEMSHLQAGTSVVHAETGESSRVFLFTHRDGNRRASFKKITTACGQTLKITRNHYLYANNKLTAAGVVVVGDNLRTIGGPCVVTEVSTVQEVGLFAPHTMHGDLVVDGIVVSGYSRAIHPDVAHALLAPVRWFSGVSGIKEPLGGLFYKGADWALTVMPRGNDRH